MIMHLRIAFCILVACFFSGIRDVVAGSVLPRENIKTFSQDPVKLKKLRDAVAALGERGLDNSTSWFTMAGIYDILSNDPNLRGVPASIQALFHQCHQKESLFFLWHRAYVAAMEHLMQDAIHDPDFRLPYWDWYSDPSLPQAFRNEFLDAQHTEKNSLYIANRNNSNVNVNGGDPIWTPQIVTDYKNARFEEIQDELNQNEHGDIHVLVGTQTNMGSINFAARDPIFYLHHANIDRLLMAWIVSDPKTHKVPIAFPGWLPTVYRFPVPPGSTGDATPPVYTPTIQELALGSTAAMGYTYDNVDIPTVPTPKVPTAPQNLQAAPMTIAQNGAQADNGPKARVFAAVKTIEVGAGGTVELAIERSDQAKISALADATPSASDTERLTLVFENVQVKALPPGLASYRVFVNLPKERVE
jgi:hypothetical protein